MIRIGNFLCVLSFGLSLIFAIPAESRAQSSPSVAATISETTIYTGERVSLSIKISGDFNDVSRPQMPDIKGFRLLSNNPSTSRSYQFINGKSSVSYSYSYYLIAQDKGKHVIPSIPVTIDGKTFKTDPLDVRIIDRNNSNQSSGTKQPDVFLRLNVSDKTPYTGQQLIASVILYFKEGLEINSYQPVPGWKAEGFWKEELKNSGRPRATSTIVHGVRYRKAQLLQFSLFPTKAGKLQISAYKIVASVRSSGSRNDPFSSFFGGFGNNIRKVNLESKPVDITVKSPPDYTKGYYLGAVGNFDISRSINTKQAKVGESIEITTRIKGTGNVPLISKPKYDLPSGLEVYEPNEKTDLNRMNGRISGTKTFTDVIIARSPGSYTIPSITMAYFSASQNDYVSKTLPAITFNVSRSAAAGSSNSVASNLEVKPITGLATWVTASNEGMVLRWWFWAGIILPGVCLAVAYWKKSYIEKMNTDRGFARSQQALDKATERLEEAIQLSKDGHIKQAYNKLQKALTGFISDRLTLAEAGLSNQDYVRALREQGIEENLVKNVRMLLDKCASISYAPDTSHEYLKSHVGLAESTLEKLKKVL